TPMKRRSDPTMRRPPRRATSTCARPASTAAATKFRRTSCPSWCWGYKRTLSPRARRGAFKASGKVPRYARDDSGIPEEEEMDLSLSDEQKQLHDAAERFVRDKYPFENPRKIAATERGWLPENWV